MGLPLVLSSFFGGFSKKNKKVAKFGLIGAGVLLLIMLIRNLTKSKTSILNQLKDDYGGDFVSVANDVAFALGTHRDISKFSIRGMTENDQRVYNIIKDLNKQEFNEVRNIYPEFTRGRTDLKNDLSANLNRRYLSRLPIYMK